MIILAQSIAYIGALTANRWANIFTHNQVAKRSPPAPDFGGLGRGPATKIFPFFAASIDEWEGSLICWSDVVRY